MEANGSGQGGRAKRSARLTGVVVATLALGACSSLPLPDVTQINPFRVDTNYLMAPNYTEFMRKDVVLRPVSSTDLVDQNGYCTGAPTPPMSPQSETGVSPDQIVPTRPVALQMTECEVVNSLGLPSNVQFGQNERGERTVTMVYATPERPVYQFAAGRLVSVERGAEAPATPPTATKPPARKQPPRRTS